jgi:CheY-like chemotaxis protein
LHRPKEHGYNDLMPDNEFELEKKRLLASIQKEKLDKKKTVVEKRIKLKQSNAAPPVISSHTAKSLGKAAFFSQAKMFKDQMGNALKGLSLAFVSDNVDEILEWMENNIPDFVFIDVDLPTAWTDAMDVFTNGTILLANTKFVIVTGNSKDLTVLQMIKKNAYAVLPKPVKVTDIKAIMMKSPLPHCLPENY